MKKQSVYTPIALLQSAVSRDAPLNGPICRGPGCLRGNRLFTPGTRGSKLWSRRDAPVDWRMKGAGSLRRSRAVAPGECDCEEWPCEILVLWVVTKRRWLRTMMPCNGPGRRWSQKSGRAETFRSMGRYNEAMAAYDFIVGRHSLTLYRPIDRNVSARSCSLQPRLPGPFARHHRAQQRLFVTTHRMKSLRTATLRNHTLRARLHGFS